MTYVTSNVGAEEIRKSGMRSQDSLLTRIMVGYSYFAFLMLAGFFSPLFGNEDGAGPLQAIFQPIMFLIYGGSIFFLVIVNRLRRALLGFLIGNVPLVLCLMLIVASALWSDDPSTTMRRAGALVGSTATALFCGLLHGKQSIRFVIRCLLIFILASVAIAVLVPSIGTHPSGKFAGNWRGLMSFKNQMGKMAALFLVVWLASVRDPILSRKWFFPVLFLATATLIMTKSATGLIIAVLGTAIYITIHGYQKFKQFRPYLVFILFLFACLIFLGRHEIISLMLEGVGRDETMSGRSSIWEESWPFIEARLWLGSGYSAFWANAERYFGYDNWIGGLNHAHNGYIEVIQDVGVVGIITQATFVCLLIYRSVIMFMRGQMEGALIFSASICLLIGAMSGSLFFRPNTANWTIFLIFSTYIWINSKTNMKRQRG